MKLRRVADKDGGLVGWTHHCPGCKSRHMIWVEQPNSVTGAKWTFNGSEEAPTFSPSVLCFHFVGPDGDIEGGWKDGKPAPDAKRVTDCHYFIRGGMIEFCGDSPHALAGQTVPLPELPDP